MRSLIYYCLLLLAGCTNASEHTVQQKDTVTSSQTVHANADATGSFSTLRPQAGCYRQVLKHDTAWLQLDIKDSAVSGSLHYKPYEKDANTGTFKGVIRDSLLVIDYTFRSEGMTSVREIVFKARNNEIFEATGPRDERTGKSIYVYRDSLQYNKLPPFVKVDCKQVPPNR